MFHNGCLPTRAKAETVAARSAAEKVGYNQPNGTFVQKNLAKILRRQVKEVLNAEGRLIRESIRDQIFPESPHLRRAERRLPTQPREL